MLDWVIYRIPREETVALPRWVIGTDWQPWQECPTYGEARAQCEQRQDGYLYCIRASHDAPPPGPARQVRR